MKNIKTLRTLISGLNRIFSRNIIWAAGVVASPAGEWLKAEVDKTGRVKVQKDLSVFSYPNIFVLGDTAAFTNRDDVVLPGLAPVAKQQGSFVGKVIADRSRSDDYSKTLEFQYIDKGNLATIGRSSAIVVVGKLKLHGFIAWLCWIFVHIYYLVGYKNRFFVLLQWAWAYITSQRGARLIVK